MGLHLLINGIFYFITGFLACIIWFELMKKYKNNRGN